jgi:hypothetical protein
MINERAKSEAPVPTLAQAVLEKRGFWATLRQYAAQFGCAFEIV